MPDLRFAFRQLAKTPGFTVVALVTLALGIGLNTSMFSVINVLLFRMPYPDSGRLVRVCRTSPQSQMWPHSVANFLDHRTQNRVFEHLAAATWATFNLAERGAPAEQLHGLAVINVISLLNPIKYITALITGPITFPTALGRINCQRGIAIGMKWTFCLEEAI